MTAWSGTRACYYLPSPPKRGVQRGATPLPGVWGCPPARLLTPPFLPGRGLGGWCAPLLRRIPPSGECRGAPPRCQGSGGVPQHFFLFPLPGRKGARGMVRAPIETKTKPPKRGVQRGAAPLPGVWGCPPALLLIPPFLEGRGLGGWCARLLRRIPEFRESSSAPPHPRLLRRTTPRNDGLEAWPTRACYYLPSPPKRGVQRGATPLPGVWGCPPALVLIPPSWKEGG